MKVVFCIALLTCFTSCKDGPPKSEYIHIQGLTMGTSYNITYNSDQNFQQEIDSILVDINDQVSTYIPSSIISVFNKQDTLIKIDLASSNSLHNPIHFFNNLFLAKEVFDLTKGNFDPSIYQLIEYWGFGKSKKPVENIDSAAVTSLKNQSAFDNILLLKDLDSTFIIKKKNKNAGLDFSAIAKGYAVDMIAEFLQSLNCSSYLVEIGGETRAKGLNKSGQTWRIGINVPDKNSGINDLIKALKINNKSIATSGNYRNFYEVKGTTYGHTINPLTGYPIQSDLQSISVLHPSCAKADALATACMVMGYDSCRKLLTEIKDAEGLFIYIEKDKLRLDERLISPQPAE